MEKLLFLFNIGAGEILIIALVVLLFFGGRKIPELMKGLGKGVKSFKEGMNEVEKNLDPDAPDTSSTAPSSQGPAKSSASKPETAKDNQ